jgi:ABC-type polar amino acid transport system ATPase subunit
MRATMSPNQPSAEFRPTEAERREPVQISLQNVTKRYGETPILNSISLDIRTGEALAIIGPSGGGKSTLLRCISLLEPVTSGEISYEGRLITDGDRFRVNRHALRLEVGLVFQEFNLSKSSICGRTRRCSRM